MKKALGLSLIEIVVVIAIISLLAVTAAPTYKKYMIQSKIQSIMPVLDSYFQEAHEYLQYYERYPNASELGLPEDPSNPGAPTMADPSSVSPLLVGGNGAVQILDFIGECGQTFAIAVGFNTSKIGFGDDVDSFFLYCIAYHVDGNNKKQCFYSYGLVSGESKTMELFPEWINMNTTTAWDFNNGWNGAPNNVYNTIISTATCQ